jgi:hypothetical protein
LLLCGIQPVNALRYFEDFEQGPQLVLEFPIDFCSTLGNPSVDPHWAATDLGVCSIEESIYQAEDQPVLSLAKSQITASSNPYPDLPFDPNSIPNGKIQGGFRYFDTGIEPTGDAEVIYTDANSGDAVGIRKLVAPGVNGNTIFLGFHPYFIEKNAFRKFLRAALRDFGEVRMVIPPKTGPSIHVICSWYVHRQEVRNAQESVHGRADHRHPEAI